jgi:hypothetical protein
MVACAINTPEEYSLGVGLQPSGCEYRPWLNKNIERTIVIRFFIIDPFVTLLYKLSWIYLLGRLKIIMKS